MALLQLKSVSLHYGRDYLLDGADLSIEAGVAAVLAVMAIWLLVEVFLVLRDKTQSPAAA